MGEKKMQFLGYIEAATEPARSRLPPSSNGSAGVLCRGQVR
jgi:hypothetical protein